MRLRFVVGLAAIGAIALAYADARAVAAIARGARPSPITLPATPDAPPSPVDRGGAPAPTGNGARADADGAPAAAIDPRAAARCEGIAVHVIAFADDPDASIAALFDARGARSVVGRRGDRVRERAVAFIGRERVWLTDGATLCQVELFGPTAADEPAARVRASPTVTTRIAIADAIRRRGERDYEIDRAALERVLEDPAALRALARLAPDAVDDRRVGFRLTRLRPDSPLAAIGLAEGDRLEKINGFDLTSADGAIEAYARLREASHLTLQITRGRQTLNFDYAIR